MSGPGLASVQVQRYPAGMAEVAPVVVLEVVRRGRRPRYHRGARLDGGLLEPEQCNMDQVVVEVRQLEHLPEGLRRPWARLCRRCWRGTPELEAADAARITRISA